MRFICVTSACLSFPQKPVRFVLACQAGLVKLLLMFANQCIYAETKPKSNPLIFLKCLLRRTGFIFYLFRNVLKCQIWVNPFNGETEKNPSDFITSILICVTKKNTRFENNNMRSNKLWHFKIQWFNACKHLNNCHHSLTLYCHFKPIRLKRYTEFWFNTMEIQWKSIVKKDVLWFMFKIFYFGFYNKKMKINAWHFEITWKGRKLWQFLSLSELSLHHQKYCLKIDNCMWPTPACR